MATITGQQLKRLIKESIHEALSGELMKLRAFAVPEVSEREQRDIERRYRRPSRRIVKTITVTP